MTEQYYFEMDPYSKCNVMMVCQKWDGSIDDYVVNNNIDAICLNYAKGWEGENLNFLHRHKQLKYFKIIDRDIEDISGINSLNYLNFLSISTYCKTTIYFKNFPDLKRCFLEWRKGSDSLFECRQLEYLYLVNFSGKIFEPISRLTNLVELNLVDPKFTTLEDIDKLSKLRTFHIVSKRLATIEHISKLGRIESLSIADCKKIERLDPISKLRHLRVLSIENLGEVKSLKPLLACKSLEELYFAGSTKIMDGQIRFLKQMPCLKIVMFKNRRHYDANFLDFH